MSCRVLGSSVDDNMDHTDLNNLDSNNSDRINNSNSNGNMKSKTLHISVKEKRARELGVIIWDESQSDHMIITVEQILQYIKIVK